MTLPIKIKGIKFIKNPKDIKYSGKSLNLRLKIKYATEMNPKKYIAGFPKRYKYAPVLSLFQ
jgi:hypothetical protein